MISTGANDIFYESMIDSDIQPPKGFSLLTTIAGERSVTYKSTGMGGLLTFLTFLIIFITSGFVMVEVVEPGAILDLVFSEWWTPFSFAAGVCAFVYYSWFVMINVFGTTIFLTSKRGISVKRCLFGLSYTRYFTREELSYLEQVKDGGEGDDSFPSWGLRLVGRRKYWLLTRQSIDKSDWLGSLIAQQLSIEYRPSDKRPVDDSG